jgi:hypothetical protein
MTRCPLPKRLCCAAVLTSLPCAPASCPPCIHPFPAPSAAAPVPHLLPGCPPGSCCAGHCPDCHGGAPGHSDDQPHAGAPAAVRGAARCVGCTQAKSKGHTEIHIHTLTGRERVYGRLAVLFCCLWICIGCCCADLIPSLGVGMLAVLWQRIRAGCEHHHRHSLFWCVCILFPVLCAVRRAVPLAMALLNVSDPGQQVVDALSRLSHDADSEVSDTGAAGACTNPVCPVPFSAACWLRLAKSG